jgi:hypothetical protein
MMVCSIDCWLSPVSHMECLGCPYMYERQRMCTWHICLTYMCLPLCQAAWLLSVLRMKVKYSAWSRDVDDARVECESDWRADIFAGPWGV